MPYPPVTQFRTRDLELADEARLVDELRAAAGQAVPRRGWRLRLPASAAASPRLRDCER